MKYVKNWEYIIKKRLLNRIEDEHNTYNEFVSISDDEFNNINQKLDNLNELISDTYERLVHLGFSEEDKLQILEKLNNLENSVANMQQYINDSVDIDDGQIDVTNIK